MATSHRFGTAFNFENNKKKKAEGQAGEGDGSGNILHGLNVLDATTNANADACGRCDIVDGAVDPIDSEVKVNVGHTHSPLVVVVHIKSFHIASESCPCIQMSIRLQSHHIYMYERDAP